MHLYCSLPHTTLFSFASLFFLISIALWRGVRIGGIKIPLLSNVEFRDPIGFKGRKLWALPTALSAIVLSALFTVRYIDICDNCMAGFPGPTAWIFVAEMDASESPPRFKQGPFASAESGQVLYEIARGTWIVTTATRRTYINNFSENGIKDARQSPFENYGDDVERTCRELPAGSRLYVADTRINGPNTKERHIWFRVTKDALGG